MIAAEDLLALVEAHGQAVGWGNGGRAEELLAQIDAAVTGLANEAATRERIAVYLDRAATRLRRTGLLGDVVTANAWAEAARWCRDDTIWDDRPEGEL